MDRPTVVAEPLAPAVRVTARDVPAHLVLGDPRHGVTRYAAELADACGARVHRTIALRPGRGPVHLHLTDRLLGATPAEAAAAVERLAARVPLTVTLHDVPQPTDGPVFGARAAAYGRVVRVARAWAASSEHERTLVARWCDPDAVGTVIALPVVEPPTDAHPVLPAAPVVGVFGFVYPGKGHRQVVRAAASLRRTGTDVAVRVIGGPAAGHDDEIDDLRRMAAMREVPFEVTGHLPDEEVEVALRSVAVPVVAHRNVSASGSLNSWLAAGRRPLVRDGAYAREVAALREGTATLFGDANLADAIAAALRRPRSTWLGPAADLRPHLDDTARAYRAWWASVAAPGPA